MEKKALVLEELESMDVSQIIDKLYMEEEEESLEVAASFATLSTLGTATGCASSLGTVSCFG